MRVCKGARASIAPAAPSRPFRLVNYQFSKTGKRPRERPRQRPSARLSDLIVIKYSTALDRARQHLFFNRKHHARLQHCARRVVHADREQSPLLVEQKDVPAVF